MKFYAFTCNLWYEGCVTVTARRLWDTNSRRPLSKLLFQFINRSAPFRLMASRDFIHHLTDRAKIRLFPIPSSYSVLFVLCLTGIRGDILNLHQIIDRIVLPLDFDAPYGNFRSRGYILDKRLRSHENA